MNDRFEIIAKSLTKKLQITANSLKEKYKSTISKELERANGFAYELYFKDYRDESLVVCEILEEEKFNGNHNLWTWIQSALFLKCWILWNSDKDNSKQQIANIIGIVNATSEFGNKNINLNVRKRRLKGSLLHYDKIEYAIKSNDRKGELSWRVGQFKELLFIYFLGGSEEFSREKALKEIKENEAIISQLI